MESNVYTQAIGNFELENLHMVYRIFLVCYFSSEVSNDIMAPGHFHLPRIEIKTVTQYVRNEMITLKTRCIIPGSYFNSEFPIAHGFIYDNDNLFFSRFITISSGLRGG